MDSEPHLGISARLDHFCDEATFVDCEQASPDLPDWQASWRHLTADGNAAELTHPSAANQTRDLPRQSSHLPVPPEAASANSRSGGPDRLRRSSRAVQPLISRSGDHMSYRQYLGRR